MTIILDAANLFCPYFFFLFFFHIVYTVALSSTLGAAILTFHCFKTFNNNTLDLASSELIILMF